MKGKGKKKTYVLRKRVKRTTRHSSTMIGTGNIFVEMKKKELKMSKRHSSIMNRIDFILEDKAIAPIIEFS